MYKYWMIPFFCSVLCGIANPYSNFIVIGMTILCAIILLLLEKGTVKELKKCENETLGNSFIVTQNIVTYGFSTVIILLNSSMCEIAPLIYKEKIMDTGIRLLDKNNIDVCTILFILSAGFAMVGCMLYYVNNEMMREKYST